MAGSCDGDSNKSLDEFMKVISPGRDLEKRYVVRKTSDWFALLWCFADEEINEVSHCYCSNHY